MSRAHELMEQALALLDAAGEHRAGALLDHAICALGLRSVEVAPEADVRAALNLER